MHPLTLVATDVPHLSTGIGGIRLILHVTAAAVWVGGQITVAGLLPTIRGSARMPRRRSPVRSAS